jgi:hypothetical protein
MKQPYWSANACNFGLYRELTRRGYSLDETPRQPRPGEVLAVSAASGGTARNVERALERTSICGDGMNVPL